jgi:hypothetical protein
MSHSQVVNQFKKIAIPTSKASFRVRLLPTLSESAFPGAAAGEASQRGSFQYKTLNPEENA